MRKVILVGFLFLLVPVAWAQMYNKTCLDNETLLIEETRKYNIGGDTYNVTRQQREECEHGCMINESRCRPAPVSRYLGVIVVVALIGIVVYAGLSMS